MINTMIKKTFLGIAIGSSILNFLLLTTKLLGNELFFNTIIHDYSRQSLCSILVGIVFSLLSMAYNAKRLNFISQVSIHMGGGLLFYFFIAFYANWIPAPHQLSSMLIFMLIFTSISFAIWGGFYLYYKHEAKKINQKISKLP